MGGHEPTSDERRRATNSRIRRVGVGATVDLAVPGDWSDVPTLGTVVTRDETAPWFSRSLRPHERSLVLRTAADGRYLLVGYDRWHASSEPILFRDGAEGVPVRGVAVVDRGIQVAADRCAADLYPRVARHGGR